MHCDLGWRQREDQPPVTGVDRLVLQHVAEKRSVSLGVLAVDDDVSAVNHAPSVPWRAPQFDCFPRGRKIRWEGSWASTGGRRTADVSSVRNLSGLRSKGS